MRVPLTSIVAVLFMLSASGASSAEETDVLQLVRLRHVVRCAGLVRPGIAVPTLDGKSWHGFAVDVCRAIAAATLGDASRISFRPYVRGEPFDRSNGETDDVVFLSSSELVADGTHVALPLVLGPVVVHDALALLVPASGVAEIASLRDRSVCVEAGSDTDRALVRYFAQRDRRNAASLWRRTVRCVGGTVIDPSQRARRSRRGSFERSSPSRIVSGRPNFLRYAHGRSLVADRMVDA
jgi:general L-amino acid transport system substrate-binding protein